MRTLSQAELDASLDGQTDVDSSVACADDDSNLRDSLLQVYPVGSLETLTTLDEDVCYVGRDRSCEIRIEDQSVSRQHAVMRRSSDGWLLMDLGSTNGTLVNDTPIVNTVLKQSDRIQFGSFVFKFLNAQHVEQKYHHAIVSRMQQDDLLDVMNKQVFLEKFARGYQQALYQDKPITVAMLDLDHFKDVNDQYGHAVGDEVLQECVRRIETVCPSVACFARFGGEEFSMMFDGLTRHAALPFAEMILHTIRDTPIATSAGPVQVTVSIGLADSMGEAFERGRECTSLIVLADARLYNSKIEGRNRISY
ncbi:MAG: GGDEF domain-containing protein [Fuerstiella sp.]